jgi:hypothetical protein
MSEVEEVVAIFGVGDHVWVPWSTIINSITIKVKTEPGSNKNTIKTNKLIRYWPAFVLERHVATKLRKVAYARIVPTSTPQNGNSLSPKYLVKLIGLNVNQVFYEKSLRSWLSFNPKPLPDTSSINDFNLTGQDISLSDITIEKLTALYVQAVQKVSNKLKPAFDPRDYNSGISKNIDAEPAKANTSSPVRLRIIYNKNSKNSVNNSSNSKAKKVAQTPVYRPADSSINANTIELEEHDKNQEKISDDETYSPGKKSPDNSNDKTKQTPLNNSEKTSRNEVTNSIIKNKIKQVELDVISTTLHEQPTAQEFSEKSNSFESLKNKRGSKSSKKGIAKSDASNIFNTNPSNSATNVSPPMTDDSSLLRRTRNGSVFGKWRASKRSRHSQGNLDNLDQNGLVLGQNDDSFISNEDISVRYDKNVSSISTPKADAVKTPKNTKRKLIIGVKKTPIDQSRFSNDDTKLANESKRRKIQDDSVKEDDIHENVDNKSMEINVGVQFRNYFIFYLFLINVILLFSQNRIIPSYNVIMR